MKISIQYCPFRVTAFYAPRVRAKIREELSIDANMVQGRYGEFQVFVDGKVVIDGGRKVLFGLMPSGEDIIEAIRQQMNQAGTGEQPGK